MWRSFLWQKRPSKWFVCLYISASTQSSTLKQCPTMHNIRTEHWISQKRQTNHFVGLFCHKKDLHKRPTNFTGFLVTWARWICQKRQTHDEYLRPTQQVYLHLCVSRQTHTTCICDKHTTYICVYLCISASHICVCASADLHLVSASHISKNIRVCVSKESTSYACLFWHIQYVYLSFDIHLMRIHVSYKRLL